MTYDKNQANIREKNLLTEKPISYNHWFIPFHFIRLIQYEFHYLALLTRGWIFFLLSKHADE